MDRIYPDYMNRMMSADQAVQMIHSGMVLGMSGFTLTGYPKMIPEALAKSGHAKNLDIVTGASVGDDMDGVLARADLIAHRYSYQSNKDLRKKINLGTVGYADLHLSLVPSFLNWGNGRHIDVAIVECAAITEQGLIPTTSVGATDAFVRMADKVIIEVNQAVPMEIMGMHDIFEIGTPPNARPIPIIHAGDHVGQPYISCPPDKIAAIVLSDRRDQPAKLAPSSAVAEKIGANIVAFLKGEVQEGRLPASLGPIQSGVGSVANAVLRSLGESGFCNLEMYTETCQDSALELLEAGVFKSVSTSSLSLSADAQQRLYEHMAWYQDKIVLRSQEITNHPEVVRRLGLVSMNTPIEVDIYGNVNSTHIMGGAIMNGIGGSGDFARNARINIFATESIAKDGKISCIVPMVSHVDHTEHDTQIIVTEQGVADLRWKTPEERAEELIEHCAHPDYRPMLREYFERAKKNGYGKHTPVDLMTALSWHQRFVETGSMHEVHDITTVTGAF